MRHLRIMYYASKQVLTVKTALALIVALFIHVAFSQFNVVDYIFYFEGLLPFVLSITFLDIVDAPVSSGQILYENKSLYSQYKLFLYRFIACIIVAIVFFFVAHMEYSILFFDKFNVNEVVNYNGIQYPQVTFMKILFVYLISLWGLTSLLVFLHVMTEKKYLSFALFTSICSVFFVYRKLPFNILSLYYYGESWTHLKPQWILIAVVLNLMIYMKFKLKGHLIT